MGHPESDAGRDPGSGRQLSPPPGSPPAGSPATGSPATGSPAAGPPVIRASDRERDAATHRLQDAFAEGRLDDAEFDERMRAALAARTRGELAGLLADLPEAAAAGPGPAAQAGARPGRLAVGIKGPVRRAGRWRVPARYTTVVYKSSGLLDLRAAELTAAVTTITAVAYKSRISILVPPGVRVEAGGFAVTSGDDAAGPGPLPPEAPVVHVRGFAYRGTVETRDGPAAG